MRSGYEIARELDKKHYTLDEQLKEHHGEILERAEQLMDDIDQLEEEAKRKIEAYVWVIRKIRDQKSPFEGLKQHHYDKYKDAHASIKAIDNKEEELKSRILKLFEVTGDDNLETETGKIYIQEYPSTNIGELTEDDKEWLAEKGYGQWEFNPNKKKILSALKDDGEDADRLKLLPIDTTITKSVRGI